VLEALAGMAGIDFLPELSPLLPIDKSEDVAFGLSLLYRQHNMTNNRFPKD
jgi:hypothetical protein